MSRRESNTLRSRPPTRPPSPTRFSPLPIGYVGCMGYVVPLGSALPACVRPDNAPEIGQAEKRILGRAPSREWLARAWAAGPTPLPRHVTNVTQR